MPARGREYGLTQNASIDERFDPEKSTRAAARHLRDLYRTFGDWYLAIAAYNCGPGTIEKAVERSGYADFWELRARRLLPAETTNYVPIILAFTIMTKNAEAYGLTDVVADDPIGYDTIEIEAPTHLALIGDLTDTPVSELVALNPAVLKGLAPQGYLLRVPKGAGTVLAASLQMIPVARRATWRIHTVAGGETLASIGKRYGASAANIVATNNLDSAEASEGDRLLIPAVAKTSPRVVKKSGFGRRTTSGASRKTVRRSPQVLTRTSASKRNQG